MSNVSSDNERLKRRNVFILASLFCGLFVVTLCNMARCDVELRRLEFFFRALQPHDFVEILKLRRT